MTVRDRVIIIISKHDKYVCFAILELYSSKLPPVAFVPTFCLISATAITFDWNQNREVRLKVYSSKKLGAFKLYIKGLSRGQYDRILSSLKRLFFSLSCITWGTFRSDNGDANETVTEKLTSASFQTSFTNNRKIQKSLSHIPSRSQENFQNIGRVISHRLRVSALLKFYSWFIFFSLLRDLVMHDNEFYFEKKKERRFKKPRINLNH